MKRTIIKLEDELGSLTSTVSDLKNEVRYLTHRLNNVNKPIIMPNNGHDIRDDMIMLEKNSQN